VEEGTAHSQVNVYTEYVDPKRTDGLPKFSQRLQKSETEDVGSGV